jgi:hypothetical protein
MVMSTATTVQDYLAQLPPDRRAVVSAVRRVVKQNLPKGYRETLNWGMICYEVPLKQYPDTYNGQPLCYTALAAQKNHIALYLMGAYADPAQRKALSDAFKTAGKKLVMGKSCLRFKTIDDLPLEAIGRTIASMPPSVLIRLAETSRKRK